MPTPRLCRCHPCRPARLTDPIDRRTVSRVRTYGFTVVAVGTGACDECGDCAPPPSEGPGFAYTIGLPHSAGHPELVVSGLSLELMNAMLQEAGQRVLQGFRFPTAGAVEGLLGRWPVVADPMSLRGLEDTVRWSRWFHRRQVDALQLVWPDTRGIFGWQPGASGCVVDDQPQEWRLAQERSGPLAPDPAWPFPVAPDHLALSCTCVVDEGAPVRLVIRELDEDGSEYWQVLCGEPHPDILAAAGLYHLAHLVRATPSLHEVADLGMGEHAMRPTCWSTWKRSATQVA